MSDGEHEVIIHLNALAKFNAFGRCMGNGHRAGRGQHRAVHQAPQAGRPGQGDIGTLSPDPAMLHLPVPEFVFGLQNALARGIRGEAFGIIGQNQIVKSRAHQGNGTGKLFGFYFEPRTIGESIIVGGLCGRRGRSAR